MKRIDEVSKKIMFEINKEFSNELTASWEDIKNKIGELQAYDTSSLEPMTSIFEGESTFLREDEVGEVMNIQDILDNAPETKQNFILLPKVVKHD